MSRSDLLAGGNPISLGREIGRGGEGTVYAVSEHPDLAIKLYSRPDAEHEAKIEAMVAAKLHTNSPLIAFPIASVRLRTGSFAGFTMKLVGGCSPLHELYAPGARKNAFPQADYRFLIHSALNISVAVTQVHEAGCVIGDINHSGILVSKKAIATLIDADSFQFGARYPCRVGVPEYTPPELQGKSLRGVIRTPTHDAFGLAVVIFQMLFMGRHPYVGRFARGDVSISEAISQGKFVYARGGVSEATPPPASAGLQDFPDNLGVMFERAFDRNYSDRPDAKSWAMALATLERSLSRCRDNDLHYFPTAAGSCLWCKMEQASGVVLFERPLPAGTPARDPGADNFNLDAVWRAIAAIRIPPAHDFKPILSIPSLKPSKEVQEVLADRRTKVVSGIALMIGAAILVGIDMALWYLYVPLAIWGYIRTYSESPQSSSVAERYRRAHTAYQKALADWRRRIGLEELHSRLQELSEARTRYAGVAEAKKRELANLDSSREQAQLRRHLERYRIRPGEISGIGRGKIATLASYGIDTAAEIQRGRILSIQGFGPATTQALVDWKSELTRKFRFNRNMTPQDRADVRQVETKFAAEAQKLRQMLAGGSSELRRSLAHVTNQAKRMDPSLNSAAVLLEQAKADLDALGIAHPKIVAIANPSPQRTAFNQAPRRSPSFGTAAVPSGTPSCPNCQSRMIKRLARRGRNRGNYFWGCSRYPSCKGTRPI